MYFGRMRAYRFLKRALDIIFSVVLLLLLSLPMAIIALAVMLTSEGGAFFRQERVGRDGKVFICYKFRTMYRWTPPHCPKSEFFDAERYITPIGRLLRRSSLDELPQLINVLKGDMSLVGPRPLIAEEGEIHLLRQRCGVYQLRPGITGLAQVGGRDSVSDIEKARLDVRYTRELSLVNDVGILFKTAFGMMTGR